LADPSLHHPSGKASNIAIQQFSNYNYLVFKKVFYNTGAQVIGKGITASITLLVTLIIGRTLGPTGYGDFTKIFVFVGYFYTLADFGLNQIYIKLARGNETSHLKVLFGLRLLIGISLAIVATTAAQVLPYNQAASTGFSPLVKTGIALAAITIITQALFTSANAYFQKILRYDLSVAAATVSYLFVLATAVIVTLTTQSLLGYTLAYILGSLVLAVMSYLIIAKRTKNFFLPKFDKQAFLTFTKPAWPVGLALLFNLIYFRIDVLILSNFRSSTEIGLYGLAYQFFEAALSIPIFFSNAIYPILASLYQTNLQEFKKQIRAWIKILTAASILLAIILALVAYLIPLIYDQRFARSVPALQILSFGMPFFFISALLWHLLIIYDKQKFLTIIYAAGAVFNIGANLIFIPAYGYIAASIITVISEALIMSCLFLAIKKFEGPLASQRGNM